MWVQIPTLLLTIFPMKITSSVTLLCSLLMQKFSFAPGVPEADTGKIGLHRKNFFSLNCSRPAPMLECRCFCHLRTPGSDTWLALTSAFPKGDSNLIQGLPHVAFPRVQPLDAKVSPGTLDLPTEQVRGQAWSHSPRLLIYP